MSTPIRFETIQSDTEGHGPYQVGLDANNKAVSCTCVHGTFGSKGVCYHKKRAEKAWSFRIAREKFVQAGTFQDRKTFDAYFVEMTKTQSVDAAIDRVITEGEKLPPLPKAEPKPEPEVPTRPCVRCKGKGHLEKFKRDGGKCYRCKGTGKDPLPDPHAG